MRSFTKLDKAQRRLGRVMQFSPPIYKMPPKLARLVFKGFDTLFGVKKERVAKVVDHYVATATNEKVLLRAYYPPKATGAVVYFHGGGCVIGDVNSYDNFCRLLAVHSEQVIISVDYRLAPEHKYPAAVIDAITSWNWVQNNKARLDIESMQVGVAGDSAGGYLAAAIGLSSIQQALSVQAEVKPAFQYLIYPLTDQRLENHSDFPSDLLLTNKLISYFKQHYLNAENEALEPLASLILASDLSESPQTHLLTAEFDPLNKPGKAYATALQKAGVEVEHSHLEDCMHGFISVAGLSSRAQQACVALAKQLRTLAIKKVKAS